jgi:uncharacterized protein
MVQLRADPWAPSHGAGAEAPFEDEHAQVVVDPAVETADWSSPLRPGPCPDEPLVFVDGVMRVDLRVLATDGARRAWGLLGSCLAGAVRCDRSARFVAEDEPVRRVMILGGRVTAPELRVRTGNGTITYSPRCIAADAPEVLRRALQRSMLDAEQALAVRLAGDALVFADGPLHLHSGTRSPVVGVVKRMVVSYLDDDHSQLLGRLEPGERTPLFALGSAVLDRYAWYVRLAARHRSWHELAGLVRCEVRMELGVEQARAVADRVCCLLPRYAGRLGIDPRAPQNLTPVGALEARLHHRLGNALVIRRALQASLSEVA